MTILQRALAWEELADVEDHFYDHEYVGDGTPDESAYDGRGNGDVAFSDGHGLTYTPEAPACQGV